MPRRSDIGSAPRGRPTAQHAELGGARARAPGVRSSAVRRAVPEGHRALGAAAEVAVHLDVVDLHAVQVEAADVAVTLRLELPELYPACERREDGTRLVARRDDRQLREVAVDVGACDLDEVVPANGMIGSTSFANVSFANALTIRLSSRVNPVTFVFTVNVAH